MSSSNINYTNCTTHFETLVFFVDPFMGLNLRVLDGYGVFCFLILGIWILGKRDFFWGSLWCHQTWQWKVNRILRKPCINAHYRGFPCHVRLQEGNEKSPYPWSIAFPLQERLIHQRLLGWSRLETGENDDWLHLRECEVYWFVSATTQESYLQQKLAIWLQGIYVSSWS